MKIHKAVKSLAYYGSIIYFGFLGGCASSLDLQKPTEIEQDFQEYRQLSSQLTRSLRHQSGLMKQLTEVKAAIDLEDAYRTELSKSRQENPRADPSTLLQNLQGLQKLLQGTRGFWGQLAQADSLSTVLIRNTNDIFDLQKRMLEIEEKYPVKK